MSTPSTRRRQVQRFGLSGIGSAVLFVGIASPAVAATDVVLPLEPTEVALVNYPAENYGGVPVDPLAPTADTREPIEVQYGETLTVELVEQLDAAAAVVTVEFPDGPDAGSDPDKVYSSDPASPDPLAVTPTGDNDLEIVLPVDDTVNGPLATLVIDPVGTVLGPEFTLLDPTIVYELDLGATAPTDTVLRPELVALAAVPCDLTATPCRVAVTAGTGLVLDLTADSVLRDLGLTDLTGSAVVLVDVDDPDAAPLELAVTVDGSRATAALPADLAAGSYGLVLGSPTVSGLSIVLAELDVTAAEPVAEPTPTAQPTQAVTGNPGLRSNTGVTAPAEETGSAAVAAGAGLLLLAAAGAGGTAVARTRRPAAGTGTGEA
jgi:hypothetical protein